MRSEFDIWLASLGARRRDLKDVDRGLPYRHIIRHPGNVTAWGLAGTVKASLDATEELAVFTIGTPAFDAGTGFTSWTVSLTDEQTAFTGVPDVERRGRIELVYDFLVSEAGGANPRRLMGGLFTVSGFVTELA